MIATALAIVPGPQPAQAGSGKISQPGGAGQPVVVELRVHVGFPPTQDVIDDLETNSRKAAEVICDATEGSMRIERVIVDAAGYGADSGDVLILPSAVQKSNFGTMTPSKPFGSASNKVRVKANQDGYLWAHELGHAILGLGEGYDSQRRTGLAYGYGPTFDYVGDPSADPDFPTNNTIMQHHNYGGSELSTPLNHDLLQGDDAVAYPGVRSGDRFTLHGSFGELDDPEAWEFDGASFETAAPFLLTAQLEGVEDGREWVDTDGDLSQGYGDRSSHWIYVYFDKTDDFEWTLYFGIDDGELAYNGQPGNAGVLTIFDELVLTFDDAAGVSDGPDTLYPLVEVDGEAPGDPSVTVDLPAVYNDGVLPGVAMELDLGGGGVAFQSDLYFREEPAQPPMLFRFDKLLGEEDVELAQTMFVFTANGLVQTGVLDPTDLDPGEADLSWRATTDRFETSGQTVFARHGVPNYFGSSPVDESDWSLYVFNMAHRQPENMNVLAYKPAGDVEPDPAAHDCDVLRDSVDFDNLVGVADHVYLVIDSSGSMDQEQNSAGTKKTRWEWAKAAAVSFAKLAEPGSMEVGVIDFDLNAVEIYPLTDLDKNAGDITTFTETLDTEAAPGDWTNIYGGLDAARTAALEDGLGGATAVMLLTDGEQSVIAPHPSVAAAQLDALGIPVFVTPLGDFDTDGLGEVVDASGGEMFSAEHKEELPIAYLEMLTRFRGESMPEFPGYASLVNGQSYSYPVLVEEGADQLSFLVSNASSDLDWEEVTVTIEGPNNELYVSEEGSASPPLELSTHGHLLRATVDDPSAGEWTLTTSRSGSTVQKVAHYIAAQIQHPSPACRVRYDKRSAGGYGDRVAVHVVATWNDVPVEEGVTYTASMRRPDGVSIDVPLEKIPEDEGVVGYFDDFAGAGNYEVSARCEVDEGATLSVGEIFPGDPIDPVPDTAPHFVRVDQSTFHGDFLDWKLPPGGDCDQDGTSDSTEGATDTNSDGIVDTAYGDARHDSDGDEIPDACDEDSDADDRPDSDEASGDLDGDGVAGRLDVDSDDDGDMDGVDLAATDPAWNRFAVGDFDNDGRQDAVHGEPSYAGTKGRIVVDFGDGDSQSLNRDSSGIEDTSYAGDEFGSSVAVGDFNDDGWDDLAVGVPGDDVGAFDAAGSIHVLYGSSTGLSSNGDQVWHQDSSGILGAAETGDRFGTRLTTGDFDGDGSADVAIGSPNEAIGSYADAGAVNVLYGGIGGVSSVDDLWYQGTDGVNDTAEGGDKFGDALAAADFDADDYEDLVIGAPDEDYGAVNSAGYVYAIYGTSTGLSTSGDFGFFQNTSGWAGTSEASDRLGARFWIDDRDGDGYPDLTVFVPGDGCGAGTHGYQVVYGDAGGLSSSGNALECLEAYQKHA